MNRIPFELICKTCGKLFTAYTSTTQYCSDVCAKRGYKAKKRKERLMLEREEIQERNRQDLLSQENLSLTDAAALLGVSRPTLYKLLESRNVELLRITKRTIRVRKSDLSNLYKNAPLELGPINTSISEIRKAKEEYISIPENVVYDIMMSAKDNLIEAHKTECTQQGFTLEFTECGLRKIARIIVESELGVRSLGTVLDKLMSDVYFNCDEYRDTTFTIDENYVERNLSVKTISKGYGKQI